MKEEIITGLRRIAGQDQVLLQEDMSRHTTFRIGGPADYYVMPETEDSLAETVKFCKNKRIPFFILGNGSNLLVGDKGYRGVVIQLYKNLNEICMEKDVSGAYTEDAPGACTEESSDAQKHHFIYAQAGAMLSVLAKQALSQGLSGLEFASGIPGTLGGAVMMNAGAYGGEMKDVIREVRLLTQEGERMTFSGDEMEFGYRSSIVEKTGYIVLGAKLELVPGDPEEIRNRMEELKEQRVSKQPLDLPSAGSTFKRPTGYFAGKLIMDAGLRGFTVGGAQVSEKHCGFVVNRGGATAADVRELMQRVSSIVNEKFGVQLEPEVRMLGDF